MEKYWGLFWEMVDDLLFFRDSEFQKKKEKQTTRKITATTEVHLEDYFTFLEDVVPNFKKPSETVDLKRKVFELD
jgi:hypothetical protein